MTRRLSERLRGIQPWNRIEQWMDDTGVELKKAQELG